MLGRSLFLVACTISASLAFATRPSVEPKSRDFPGWPSTFEGAELERVEMNERERDFYAEFPGYVARFTDGEREIILRWVEQPTQHLHPAATCFRGRGFDVTPAGGLQGVDGRTWGSFRAQRDDDRFTVRELVYTDGRSWSDISAWYWSASLGRTQGPWWAVMVAERR